jgi:hypothetical protein
MRAKQGLPKHSLAAVAGFNNNNLEFSEKFSMSPKAFEGECKLIALAAAAERHQHA